MKQLIVILALLVVAVVAILVLRRRNKKHEEVKPERNFSNDFATNAVWIGADHKSYYIHMRRKQDGHWTAYTIRQKPDWKFYECMFKNDQMQKVFDLVKDADPEAYEFISRKQ